MDKVIHKKTFSKILVAINESSKSADKAVDYATKISQDYNSLLIILYVIRAQANLQTLNLPSHIIQFKKQAESYLSKISEKIYTQSEAEDIVRFKTEIIASLRIADAIVSYAKDNHIDLIVLGPRGRSKTQEFSSWQRYIGCR